MRWDIIVMSTIVVAMVGCSNKDKPTGPTISDASLYEYLAINAGNSWTYSLSRIDSLGMTDPASIHSTNISVFQTNTLISGQPNAFILHEADNSGEENNLAFFINERTLYHFLGEKSILPVPTNFINWSAGEVSGIKVGLNQNQKFIITDWSGNRMSFSIKRQPNPNIARTIMVAADTLGVDGISLGNTTLILEKIGGTENDTMMVLIEVSPGARPLGPPFVSWMPIWQLPQTKTEEAVLYLWDTTYSFRSFLDTALCSDRISYLITNRYVGGDSITLSNTVVWCEKYEMKIIVTETIKYTDRFLPFTTTVFDGLSTKYIVTTWLAKGIGFVKGIMGGNSRSLAVTMGGAQDSLGILHGFYFSPRVGYAVLESASSSSVSQYFHIDDTPLAPKLSSESFVLMSKNF